MTIEVNRTYIDGKGRKVLIFARAPKSDPDGCEFVGQYEDGRVDTWADDGKCWDENQNIKAEYREPVVHRRWVVWWRMPDGTLMCQVSSERQEERPHLVPILHQEEVTFEEPAPC